METIKALTEYTAAFVDELARTGITEVVISPGSRSTPMALLMAEHPNIQVHMIIDERSAGFFALGMAKSKRLPVALLCTSGTAAANYLPAIVEAYYSRVPLLILTADRPHELRDVGAPQAIDQIHLYGKYAKWFVDMALPEDSEEMIRYVRTIAERASAIAQTPPVGPVHLNFPFREPLVPNLSDKTVWNKGEKIKRKFVSVTTVKPSLTEKDFKLLSQTLKQYKNGLIICGALDQPGFPEAVTKLAEKLQFPILADPLSQLRAGNHDKRFIIDGYDTFLRNEEAQQQLIPEVVIRFGAMPVSKVLFTFLKNHPQIYQIVVDGEGGWRDPTLLADEMIYCHEMEFCQGLLKTIGEIPENADWIQRWNDVNQYTKKHLEKINTEENLFEGKVFTELLNILPDKCLLFVGNSMPIRDLDTFFTVNEKNIRIMANRGANGIDGIVSTALGASVVDAPLILVIGDLSFYHDLNGLLAAKLHDLKATIIVMNNDGGGIFSFLPQAKEKTHFETLFGTPLGLDYEYAVRMYQGQFARVHSWGDFREKVSQSLKSNGLSVIEVPTNRQENAEMHRNLWNAVSQEISNMLQRENKNEY
jgi:2-succinyl-5-enolpyruvyl-6-hydroxy-3-cyclohexene-1-carboxylate synthase